MTWPVYHDPDNALIEILEQSIRGINFIIARQHAMHAERDTVFVNLSVCPSVRPSRSGIVSSWMNKSSTTFSTFWWGHDLFYFQQSQTANPRRGISSPKHCHHLWSWTQNSTVGHRATVEMSLTFVDHSFIHSFTHSPTHPSIHPSIHSFIHSLICSEWQVQIRQCVTSVSSRHSRGKSPRKF